MAFRQSKIIMILYCLMEPNHGKFFLVNLLTNRTASNNKRAKLTGKQLDWWLFGPLG